MILNMSGGGKKKEPIIPVFSGAHNFVTSEDGQSGYIEIYESGTLGWTGSVLPKAVDITCVGAGGGGSKAFANKSGNDTATWLGPGAGGAGGFVVNAFGVELPEFLEVVIGAGGNAEAAGGTTSVGEVCEAAGGTGATVQTYYEPYYTATRIVGQKSGSGGNAGGVGYIRAYNGNVHDGLGGDFAESDAAYGRSNGEQHTVVSSVARAVLGSSQGTPTTDILGRKHAGGGSAGRYTMYSDDNKTGFAGGESDFTSGAGLQGGKAQSHYVNYQAWAEGGYGGGGYGGGGGGGGLAYMNSGYYKITGAGAAGGNGFVIIGWGDYLALYEAQSA